MTSKWEINNCWNEVYQFQDISHFIVRLEKFKVMSEVQIEPEAQAEVWQKPLVANIVWAERAELLQLGLHTNVIAQIRRLQLHVGDNYSLF